MSRSLKRTLLDSVRLLHWIADRLGTTYEAVNVWFFIVIRPSVTAALNAVVVIQQMKIHKLLKH